MLCLHPIRKKPARFHRCQTICYLDILSLKTFCCYEMYKAVLSFQLVHALTHVPKGFARAILSVQLTCEICYYTCKCAMHRTPSNFFF